MKILTTSQISLIVKDNPTVIKWGLWSTYNDKLAGGKRKLKYMRNGWRVPDEMKTKIVNELQQEFKDTNVESVSFEIGVSGSRGEYDFLKIIKIENI